MSDKESKLQTPGHFFEVPVENYLKGIWTLSLEKGSLDAGIKNSELADYLNVKRPSVTNMIQKLKNRGLLVINIEKKTFQLSDSGIEKVKKLLRRHKLIELFLEQSLGLNEKEAHEEAELLEHALSASLEEKIFNYLERPQLHIENLIK